MDSSLILSLILMALPVVVFGGLLIAIIIVLGDLPDD